jgi:hypothetical protein
VNDQSFILTLKHAICYGSAVTSDEVTDALRSLVAHCIAEARKPDPGSDADLWRASCAKLERERRDNEATIATLRKELAAALTSEPTAPPKECPTCHGTGEVPDRHDPLGDTHPSKMERCEECDGHGAVEKQPSDAAKAWRERAWDACVKDAYNRGAALPSHRAIWPALDEAVALITAAEQRADAHIRYERKTTDVAFARVNAERDAIQRERAISHDWVKHLRNALIRCCNDGTDGRVSDSVSNEFLLKVPEECTAVRKQRDTAIKRAEAAEEMREVYCNDRDDLRARLDKLLAELERVASTTHYMSTMRQELTQAIAEARSGATDAPQAKEGT